MSIESKNKTLPIDKRGFLKVAGASLVAGAGIVSGVIATRGRRRQAPQEPLFRSEPYPSLDEEMKDILGPEFQVRQNPVTNDWEIAERILGEDLLVYQFDSGESEWIATELLPLAIYKRAGELVGQIDPSRYNNRVPRLEELGAKQRSWEVSQDDYYTDVIATYLDYIDETVRNEKGKVVGDIRLTAFSRDGEVLWVPGAGEIFGEEISIFMPENLHLNSGEDYTLNFSNGRYPFFEKQGGIVADINYLEGRSSYSREELISQTAKFLLAIGLLEGHLNWRQNARTGNIDKSKVLPLWRLLSKEDGILFQVPE